MDKDIFQTEKKYKLKQKQKSKNVIETKSSNKTAAFDEILPSSTIKSHFLICVFTDPLLSFNTTFCAFYTDSFACSFSLI